MLLAGHTDAKNVLAIAPGLSQGRAGGGHQCPDPVRRILFAAAIGAFGQGVGRTAFAQYYSALDIQDHRLGALGAAVDPEKLHAWPLLVVISRRAGSAGWR